MPQNQSKEKEERRKLLEIDIDRQVNSVCIVGGGSAGWLTACIMATSPETKDLDITLVESPSIPTVGVGEATYVTIVETMRSIGVSEKEFMKECDATFKQAILFDGWCDKKFYHPFNPPVYRHKITRENSWIDSGMKESYARCMSFQPSFCDDKLSPKSIHNGDFIGISHYAYHFDASLVAKFLSRHAVNNLGVKHKYGNVDSIEKDHVYDRVVSLGIDDGDQVVCDFYIDCTGFSRKIIGGEGFVKKESSSGIDSACFINAKHTSEIESFTKSTAATAGWIWDIPLRSRRGIGYCFSSERMDPVTAAEELIDYCGDTYGKVKHIKFPVGYMYEPWQGNVVAIGNSCGFVEPLESTAIGMIESCVKDLCLRFPKSDEDFEILSQQYNQRTTSKWESIFDFIELHYLLSQKDDSPFWRSVFGRIENERVKNKIITWKNYPILDNDFFGDTSIFNHDNWRYIFYGMINPESVRYKGESESVLDIDPNVEQARRSAMSNNDCILDNDAVE